MVVKVYTTQACPWCRRVREYLKKNGVEFTEVDVSQNPEASKELITKSGQMGVPVTVVDGAVVVGYDEDALKKALGG